MVSINGKYYCYGLFGLFFTNSLPLVPVLETQRSVSGFKILSRGHCFVVFVCTLGVFRSIRIEFNTDLVSKSLIVSRTYKQALFPFFTLKHRSEFVVFLGYSQFLRSIQKLLSSVFQSYRTKLHGFVSFGSNSCSFLFSSVDSLSNSIIFNFIMDSVSY